MTARDFFSFEIDDVLRIALDQTYIDSGGNVAVLDAPDIGGSFVRYYVTSDITLRKGTTSWIRIDSSAMMLGALDSEGKLSPSTVERIDGTVYKTHPAVDLVSTDINGDNVPVCPPAP